MLIAGVSTAAALAAAPAQARGTSCPCHSVCDATLGVSISPPVGWHLLPAGKYPSHTLAFRTGTPVGLSYHLRLVIEPYALTSIANDASAAKLVAQKLIQAERVSSVTRQTVRYGRSQGVLVRGLPGGPAPALDIILAHQKAAYLIIAPGSSLAADQRRALRTLRFIPRTGHFLPPVGGGR
ncbi:MAG TPA: hypothetical protein DEV93_01165 [Chloroflexi bacterium]|nr:hypothetical protein [Chloroflexota bacterium]